VAEPFQNGYRWIRTIWSAHKDAERLAEELQLLQGEAVKLKEQAEENQRLRSLLDFQEKGTFPEGIQFKVARVTGKSPTRWQAWILVDKGSADGVEVDQAVVGATPIAGGSLAGKGLVGKVISVTAHEAQVLLITDSESSVAAKIQGLRAEGIVQGSVSGSLIMDFVDRDIPVDPKLVIVTSGYGGIYPPAIPIGIVASVGEEDVNPHKEIDVQAFVDFRVLEEVMVLLIPSTTTTTALTSTTTSTTISASTSTTTTTTVPSTGQ